MAKRPWLGTATGTRELVQYVTKNAAPRAVYESNAHGHDVEEPRPT